MQKSDSFILLWILLKLDPAYKETPSKALFVLEEQFEKEGVFVKSIEGKKTSGWILMDYGDIIVNLLTVEMREKYNIEKVWGDCEFLNLED